MSRISSPTASSRSASGPSRLSSSAAPRTRTAARAGPSSASRPSRAPWVSSVRRTAWRLTERSAASSSSSPGRRFARRSSPSCHSRNSRSRAPRSRIRSSSVTASTAARQAAWAAATAREGGLGAGEGVEQASLGVGVEERLVLVLAVDVDQQPAQLAELAGSRRAAVQPRGAAAADLPAENELGLRLEAHLLQQREGGGDVGDLEHALDQRPFGAVADLVGAGPGAEREGQGVDDQRLAAARLAGQQVETGAEADLRARDQRQVTNPE